MFLGAGLPEAKPKEGFDFGIVDLVVDDKGVGVGTMSPAAKVTVQAGRLRRRRVLGRAGPAHRRQEGEVAPARLEYDVDWNDVDTSGLLQLAIEAFPNGILLIDSRGTIALVNREAEHQFGYTRAELIGRGVERLLPEAVEPSALAQTGPSPSPSMPTPPKWPATTFGRLQGRIAVLARAAAETDPHGGLHAACSRPSSIATAHAAATAPHGAVAEEQLAFEQLAAELSNDS